MGKRMNKAFKRLDRRQKAWDVTKKDVGSDKIRGYRRPGSMKK